MAVAFELVGCTSMTSGDPSDAAITTTDLGDGSSASSLSTLEAASSTMVTATSQRATAASITAAPAHDTLTESAERVRYDAGTSSKSVSGQVDAASPRTSFVLGAAKGQTISLALATQRSGESTDADPTSPGVWTPGPTLSLYDPMARLLMVGATRGIRTLPATGDYLVVVEASSPDAITFDLATSIVDGVPAELCLDSCMAPTWQTQELTWPNESWDISAQLAVVLDDAGTANEQFLEAITREINIALGDHGSSEARGSAGVFAEVRLATPTLIALEITFETYVPGTAHPNDDYRTFIWDPIANRQFPPDWLLSTGDPETATNETRLPLDVIRTAVAEDLTSGGVPADSLDRLDVSRSSAVTPALEGILVSFARCELIGCVLGGLSVTIPYEAWTGPLNPVLIDALSGPFAVGN